VDRTDPPDRVLGIAWDAMPPTDAAAALRHAIEGHELRIAYQPIMQLTTRRVVGVEALVRWAHPERGLIMPDAFIPLAEETGLILPIGRWVRRESFRHVRECQRRFPPCADLRLSTNLSVQEFRRPDLIAHLTTSLEASGFPPPRLTLEVTEHAMRASDPEDTISTLYALKWLGLQLAFVVAGMEYASPQVLHRFPVDQVKMHRSVVAGLGQSSEATALVEEIVRSAIGSGVTVIAEGVETADHVAHLQQLGCEEGQGFFFAPPLELNELEVFLQNQIATAPVVERAEPDSINEQGS
jgi:EAL domain-containing protein (putative c-di-GMP-specific phosphodiesterase class I)